MGIRKWIYYDPVFESDEYNYEMMAYSPWSGHRQFAYDYVRNIKPGIVVELGSYYGCSSFAMLQAIKDGGLETSFYGIDTWKGDDFTEGDYSEDIFGKYREIQDGCFAAQDCHMVRMLFDDALQMFDDSSIDLLHIDGSHKYEDVKHDFEAWQGKVSDHGVVFFHDIGEDLLYGEHMGSHYYWEELKDRHEYVMEFPFSFGLGVFFNNPGDWREFTARVDIIRYQKLINMNDAKNKDVLRKQFFLIRDQEKYISSLKNQVAIKESHLEKHRQTEQERGRYIRKLVADKEAAAEKTKEEINEYKQAISRYEEDASIRGGYEAELEDAVKVKGEYIAQLECSINEFNEELDRKNQYISELQDTIKEYDINSSKKDEYIEELKGDIDDLGSILTAKEGYIEELKGVIKEYASENEKIAKDYDATIRGKESYIEELKNDIDGLSCVLTAKDEYIDELKGTIRAYASENERIAKDYDATIRGKESYIEELKNDIDGLSCSLAAKEGYILELREGIEKYAKDADDKNAYIDELSSAIDSFQTDAAGKDSYILELKDNIESYAQTVDGKERYIRELEDTIGVYRDTVDGKERYIRELEDTVGAYRDNVDGKEEYIKLLEIEKEKLISLNSDCSREIEKIRRRLESMECTVNRVPIMGKVIMRHTDKASQNE